MCIHSREEGHQDTSTYVMTFSKIWVCLLAPEFHVTHECYWVWVVTILQSHNEFQVRGFIDVELVGGLKPKTIRFIYESQPNPVT